MAAGRAAMKAYDAPAVDHVNTLGARLREGFNQAFAQSGIRGQATGMGSIANLHFTTDALHDSRDSIAATVEAGHIPRLLHLSMLRHGVMSASRLMYCTSTAMREEDVDAAVTAMHESLAELRPYVEAERPGLMR